MQALVIPSCSRPAVRRVKPLPRGDHQRRKTGRPGICIQ
jgi:hypothetical protein